MNEKLLRIPLRFLLLFLFHSITSAAQGGFLLPNKTKKDVIPFELVNNLVIVPVEVNGTQLSFLLDTGVDSTIIFGIKSEDSLNINNAVKVKMRGLGAGGTVDAYRSLNNVVRIGEAIDQNHSLYFIFESALNFSTRMGVPVHGIIGYDFFKSFVIETNYVRRRLTVHDPKQYVVKKCRKCEEFDLTFYNNKPYLNATITTAEKTEAVTLLVDSGSSDAIWLFKDAEFMENSGNAFFQDYLGFGLSGNIYGKRSKLNSMAFGKFTLDGVKVAYPEVDALKNVQLFKERDGSLGGEVLKRFKTLIDYGSKKIYLKRNSFFNDPFYYNMSGLILEHNGVTAVKEVTGVGQRKRDGRNLITSDVGVSIPIKKIANIYLAPKYVVAEVRPDSPAALADIRVGDEIISINGNLAFRYKLHEINEMFYSKEGKRMFMIIRRNGYKELKKRFTLKKVL